MRNAHEEFIFPSRQASLVAQERETQPNLYQNPLSLQGIPFEMFWEDIRALLPLCSEF